MNRKQLDRIFGPDSVGETASDRARTSKVVFVRSQDHLALAKPSATGRQLSAFEALDAFGEEVLFEVVEFGSAVLPASSDEPGASLQSRRDELGLELEDVSGATALSIDEVADCENPDTRSPIRNLETIAAAVGLDERRLSVEVGAGGDAGLAVRLKQLGHAQTGFSAKVVMTLSEAAWVIRTQARLRRMLNSVRSLPPGFEPSPNYGSSNYPVWEHGYFLARRTREILGISADVPVESVREVCERLQVPLLCATLPEHIAGATVVSSDVRGIVVNTQGPNSNVWVRRATIAHELGHLLWDPNDRLRAVSVDEYSDLEALSRDDHRKVEARANAFAIAFLAPLAEVEREFLRHADRPHGIRAVMERFGISFSAAKHHISNAFDEPIDLEFERVSDWSPTDDWRGREAYTDDYFPIASTPQLRKGMFAGLVVEAQSRGLISLDTACTYLHATLEDFRSCRAHIASLFPIDTTPEDLI